MSANGLSPWRRVPADAGDWFSAEEVERGRRYRRPLDRMGLLQGVIGVVVILAFVEGEGAREVIEGLDVSGWALQLVAIVIALELVSLIFRPWFSAWQVFVHDREWDLSTQRPGHWAVDQVKELLLATVITLLMAVPLYALIRGTELWWVWGWLLFTGFAVLFGYLFPVVFAPIFNRFDPLEDEDLDTRIRAVAVRAGLEIEGVYVADASIRSRATNAYVAGLGNTRRVVLFDTILEYPPEQLEQVVAHELGHWKYGHIARQLPFLAAVQLLAFFIVSRIMEAEPVLDWVGVAELGDPRTYPLLFLVYPAVLAASGAWLSWLSRAFERQADLHALEVLDDPDAFIAVFRRLAADNKADLDPPWWRRLRAAHPPVPERMAMAARWRADASVDRR